jgi:hypothetical protein
MKSMSAYVSKKNVEVQGRTYKIQDSQRILNTFNMYRGAAQCSTQSYEPIFYNRFRKCPKINCPKPFVLGSVLNGGSPNSTFPFILNGGSPNSSFPLILNGGKPPLPTILNDVKNKIEELKKKYNENKLVFSKLFPSLDLLT